MISEDCNRTSLLRLFHSRHNAENSRSTSQVFDMDISVQGPSPAVETGRALAGRDAEHVKSGSHRDHPPETFSPLGKLPPTFRAQTSQQESPESCSVVLSTSKQRQTRPFIPTLPPAFCKEEGARNKAASTKGESKRRREVSTR